MAINRIGSGIEQVPQRGWSMMDSLIGGTRELVCGALDPFDTVKALNGNHPFLNPNNNN
jgi:hypothetical protein